MSDEEQERYPLGDMATWPPFYQLRLETDALTHLREVSPEVPEEQLRGEIWLAAGDIRVRITEALQAGKVTRSQAGTLRQNLLRVLSVE